MTPIPRPPKDQRQNRRPFAHRPPEVRKAIYTKIQAARKKGHRYGQPTVPRGWTLKTFAPFQIAAKEAAQRIFKQMEKDGQVPEDVMAQQALKLALTMMHQPGPKEIKLKALRTVLEYTKAKPATKSDVTLRTAEDFLDELSASEDDGNPGS